MSVIIALGAILILNSPFNKDIQLMVYIIVLIKGIKLQNKIKLIVPM